MASRRLNTWYGNINSKKHLTNFLHALASLNETFVSDSLIHGFSNRLSRAKLSAYSIVTPVHYANYALEEDCYYLLNRFNVFLHQNIIIPFKYLYNNLRTFCQT